MLKEGSFQMSAPTLTTTINGKQKTLYLEKIAKTHDNLNKKLGALSMGLFILTEILFSGARSTRQSRDLSERSKLCCSSHSSAQVYRGLMA